MGHDRTRAMQGMLRPDSPRTPVLVWLGVVLIKQPVGLRHDSFILYIARYVVLREISFIPDTPGIIIKNSLPVHAPDVMPHFSGCRSRGWCVIQIRRSGSFLWKRIHRRGMLIYAPTPPVPLNLRCA